jgi:hypothetical protein
MITQNQIMADSKSDLYGAIFPNTWMCLLMGEFAERDTPMRIYQYSSASTAADDGENVIKPTGVAGAGRWLKYSYQQLQADWGQLSSAALTFIANKPNLSAVATSGAYTDLSGKPSLATVASTGSYSDLTGKPSLATVATSGSYNDLSNLPSRSASVPSRSLNAAGVRLSTTRDALVFYTCQIAATISLTTGQTGTILLQTSPDNTTWATMASFTNGNTGSLTIGLNLTQTAAQQLSCFVPATYYVRLTSSGTATSTITANQLEVLM